MGLVMMFKKSSSNNKELSYNEFLICLEKIARVLFPGDSYAYQDRMDELDKYLGVDVYSNFKEKMKTMNTVFHTNEE